MKELIDPTAVERILLLLAIAGPLAGLIIGIVYGLYKRRILPMTIAGLLIGLLGTLVYFLWQVYNAITDVIGLDRVANLVVQLVMFAVFGILLGIAACKLNSLVERLSAGN
jgi:xanthosine utilization system XapX-like protein